MVKKTNSQYLEMMERLRFCFEDEPLEIFWFIEPSFDKIFEAFEHEIMNSETLWTEMGMDDLEDDKE